jgi:hypothetical protein
MKHINTIVNYILYYIQFTCYYDEVSNDIWYKIVIRKELKRI